MENDIYAPIDNGKQLEQSLSFEHDIEKVLVDNNVKFQTQEELVKIQMKEYGKPISTPDFLITNELFINGNKINWIDAKNFYGANVSFIKHSIEKQIQKYIKNYGDGLIVFSLNYNENLKFNNVMLIGYDDFKIIS